MLWFAGTITIHEMKTTLYCGWKGIMDERIISKHTRIWTTSLCIRHAADIEPSQPAIHVVTSFLQECFCSNFLF